MYFFVNSNLSNIVPRNIGDAKINFFNVSLNKHVCGTYKKCSFF